MFNQIDGFIVSLVEHNGPYSAAIKSVFDWLSRINQKMWNNKPMLLMTTSSGVWEGAGVKEAAKSRFPRKGVLVM